MKKLTAIFIALLTGMISIGASAATASALVKIDSTEGHVSLFIYDSAKESWRMPEINTDDPEGTWVEFDDETETRWNIEGSMKVVTLNGEVIGVNVPYSADGFDIYGMADGDVLDIVGGNIITDCTITFDFGDNGPEVFDFVTLNGYDASIVDGQLNAAIGDVICLIPSPAYSIKSVMLDDEELMFYAGIEAYMFTVESSVTVTVDAQPRTDRQISLTIDDADAVKIFFTTRAFDEEEVLLRGVVNGTQTITLPAATPFIRIYTNHGYTIVSATATSGSGQVYGFQDQLLWGYRYINADDNDIVAINITTDQPELITTVVYCPQPWVMPYYFIRTADQQFPVHSDSAPLLGDYSIFDIIPSQNPVKLVFDYKKNNVPVILYNDELLQLTNEDNSLSGYITLTDCGVLRVFPLYIPQKYIVSFYLEDIAPEEITVLADIVTPVSPEGEHSFYQGTRLTLEGERIDAVYVNGEPVETVNGVCTITVEDDCEIGVGGKASITDITADRMQGRVFNLQGIEMKRDNLPAGIYIVNGKKTVIK